jgi:CheY-like chemotaxis protein
MRHSVKIVKLKAESRNYLYSYTWPEDKIRLQSAGFDDYISMSIKPKDLIEVLEKYI